MSSSPIGRRSAPSAERWVPPIEALHFVNSVEALKGLPGVQRVVSQAQLSGVPGWIDASAAIPPNATAMRVYAFLEPDAPLDTRRAVQSVQDSWRAVPDDRWKVELHAVDVRDAFLFGVSPAQASILAASSPLGGSLEQVHWVCGAAAALAPFEPAAHAVGKAGQVAALELPTDKKVAADVKLFRDFMETPGGDYSVDEVRRLLAASYHGHLEDVAYVREKVLPHLTLDRPIDRFGAEPHFHFAAHLAHFLLGAPVGATEQDVFARFLDDPRLRVRQAWPRLSVQDLPRLRRLYPFLPSWPEGTKSAHCPTLSPASFDRFPHLGAVWGSAVAAIQELASVPMVDPLLEDVETLRTSLGHRRQLLERFSFAETIGTFSDTIGFLQALVQHERLPGHRIHHVAKHYSGHPTAIDLAKRVYGVRVQVESTDDGVLSASQAATEHCRQLARDEGTQSLVHIEGVKGFWPWLTQRLGGSNERLAGVSHTSSDWHDLVSNGAMPEQAVIANMARSQAKLADERVRFPVTLTALATDLLTAVGDPVLERRWLVLGMGKLMGPSMVDACKNLGLTNYTTFDTDEGTREELKASGIPVTDSVASETGRPLIVVSCAGTQTLDAAQLSAFAGGPPVYLLSLGSGRREFDMDWLEKHATFSRPIAHLGHQPIVEYTLELEGKPLVVRAVAAGYPANLAYLHPTAAAYAGTTSLEGWEAMQQAAVALERGETGLVPVRSMEIELTPEAHPRRVVILSDPDLAEAPPSLQAVGDFHAWFEAHPDAPFFYMERRADGTLRPLQAREHV